MLTAFKTEKNLYKTSKMIMLQTDLNFTDLGEVVTKIKHSLTKSINYVILYFYISIYMNKNI